MSTTHGNRCDDSATGDEWDARAQVAVGVMLRRYLQENPPPPDATFPPDIELWASNLLRHGEARLALLGARHLTSVGGES